MLNSHTLSFIYYHNCNNITVALDGDLYITAEIGIMSLQPALTYCMHNFPTYTEKSLTSNITCLQPAFNATDNPNIDQTLNIYHHSVNVYCTLRLHKIIIFQDYLEIYIHKKTVSYQFI